MDLGLKDKVAVVTGGSRGLGFYSARALAAEGARLAICARGEEGLGAAAAALRQAGTEVLAVACDIAAADGADTLLGAVRDRYGGIDILVNNVGGNRRGRFEETSDQDWLDIIELNVLAGVQGQPRRHPDDARAGAAARSCSFHRCSGGRRAARDCRSTTRPNRR